MNGSEINTSCTPYTEKLIIKSKRIFLFLCKITSSIELANTLAEKNEYVYVIKRLSATMQAVVFLSVFISCRGP